MPKEIIDATKNGELVLFCGAGISTEGKNVMPYSFYEEINDELEGDMTKSFSVLMQEYCNQPNGRKKLLKKIQNRFAYIKSFPELERAATSFHKELSEIHQIKTIITTNWDTYFETVCGAIPITTPEDYALFDEKERHVIKIHGTIDILSSLVATESDYASCYERLQNGGIGAELKRILARKTVIFIGFSFGDEDFDQIIKYMREEMHDLYPYVYFVSLDKDLGDKVGYDNSEEIVTTGEYFLHCLKNELVTQGLIVNSGIQDKVIDALEYMKSCHNEISKISIKDKPLVIFTLAYQDGVIHAFERYLQIYNTGEYNEESRCQQLLRSYEILMKERI